MSAPEIRTTAETLQIEFDAWGPEAYGLFLRTKHLPEHRLIYDREVDRYTVEAPLRFARILGLDAEPVRGERLPFPSRLWDYQRHFLQVALEAKRYAFWWDTGLGKTPALWDWCRQVQARTGGKVLLIAPLNLIPPHLDEAIRSYGQEFAASVRRLGSKEDLRTWCEDGVAGLAVTNPEKFLPRDGEEVIPEITRLAGICLDESSLLKTGGGRLKWALIKSCRGVEYKLSCTATPAPNDPIEYASQASWLETIRNEGEVIWTYFTRDKEGEWKIKDHALAGFYEFLSGWSCYLRRPERYGFADNVVPVPAPEVLEHPIAATREQLAAVHQVPDAVGQMSLIEPTRLGVVERIRMGTLSSGFLYEEGRSARRIPSGKPAKVLELTLAELAAKRQVLIWTLYDETAAILLGELRSAGVEADSVTGATPQQDRHDIVRAFVAGGAPVLVSRPQVLGFGQNLQNVGAMVFADFDDSFERMYQSIRRAVRYGQAKAVRIHIPYVPELQRVVLENLHAKAAQFEGDVARMERLYIEAMRDLLPQRRAA